VTREERVWGKLPELLTEGSTTQKKNYRKYRRDEYRLRKARKKQDKRVKDCVRSVAEVLDDLEDALSKPL